MPAKDPDAYLMAIRALVTLAPGRGVASNRAALEALVRAWIEHV